MNEYKIVHILNNFGYSLLGQANRHQEKTYMSINETCPVRFAEDKVEEILFGIYREFDFLIDTDYLTEML